MEEKVYTSIRSSFDVWSYLKGVWKSNQVSRPGVIMVFFSIAVTDIIKSSSYEDQQEHLPSKEKPVSSFPLKPETKFLKLSYPIIIGHRGGFCEGKMDNFFRYLLCPIRSWTFNIYSVKRLYGLPEIEFSLRSSSQRSTSHQKSKSVVSTKENIGGSEQEG